MPTEYFWRDKPAPQLEPELQYLYNEHRGLGTDQGGRPMVSEIQAWFVARGVTDPQERALIEMYFAAITSAQQLEQAKWAEDRQAEIESKTKKT